MYLLVLTGTTGYPLLEDHIQSLAHRYPDLNFIVQSPNPQEEKDNLTYYHFLDLESFDYSTIDGVIGHCGAGTVFWTLERELPLLAIVDLSRPDGHQNDLGEWLRRNNYCTVIRNREPAYEEIAELVSREYAKYIKEPFSLDELNRYLGEDT